MIHKLHEFHTQITWVADALIPPGSPRGMPGASEIGIPEKLLPEALKARDDLAPAFFSALQRLPEKRPEDPLGAIRDLGAEDFHTLSFLIAGAYFLDENINMKLRYPGQEEVRETTDYDEIIETVERVASRGRVFTETPNKAT